MSFKTGDIVHLNSDKMVMTVRSASKKEVSCDWFAEQKLHTATFHPDQIMIEEVDKVPAEGIEGSNEDVVVSAENRSVEAVPIQDLATKEDEYDTSTNSLDLSPAESFKKLVDEQISFLNDGLILEIADKAYSENILMYDNDQQFASGKNDAISKQEPYVKAAVAIDGKIVDIKIDPDLQIAVFRNKSRFMDDNGNQNSIDGLVWQKWENGLIVEERYYTGEMANEKSVEFYQE